MTESEVKTKMTKNLRLKEGGYGRRFEDQYAVGIPDTVLIPRGGPVFFGEVKIVDHWAIEASPRQKVELQRILDTRVAIPVLIGYQETTKRLAATFFDANTLKGPYVAWTQDWAITTLLQLYYEIHKERFGG